MIVTSSDLAGPPGRCARSALLVAIAIGLLILFGWLSPVRAQKHHAHREEARPASQKSATASATASSAGNKTPRSKNYTFTGLDIDGRLKTPQLLYFLNRMKAEFDTTTPAKRSFLPELKRSTDEM